MQNDQVAGLNRVKLDEKRVFFHKPNGFWDRGKTSLILQTIQGLNTRMQIGVIEGDTAPVTIVLIKSLLRNARPSR